MFSDKEDLEEPKKKRLKNGDMEESETQPQPVDTTSNGKVPDTKWQVEKKDVKARIAHLRISGEFTDCTILVGNSDDVVVEIEAHRMVLAMSSPKFEEMLLKAGRDEPLKITDIDPTIFNILLDYMYLDQIDIKTSEEASQVYKAALAYELPYLCELTAKHMAKEMNFSNVWSILDFVAETQEPFLKEECNKFVKKNPSLVLQHDSFPKVSQGVVSSILDLDCFDVSELDMILAVDRWAVHQCSSIGLTETTSTKREILGPDILHKLRFLAVPREDFVRKLAYTGEDSKSLLTLEESYAVLMNSTAIGSFPVPKSLSLDHRSRKLSRLRCIRRLQATAAPTFGGPGVFGAQQPGPFHHTYGTVTHPPTPKSPSLPAGQLGSKVFFLEVRVDYPVLIYGIQVPTLPFPLGHNAKTFIKKEYDESFIVTVQDFGGSTISQTIVTVKIPFGSVIDLELKNSVSLQKNVTYKIQICTSNSYVLNRKLCCVEDCPPVRFFFKDSCKLSVIPSSLQSSFSTSKDTAINKDADFGFVNQIIYSLGL